MSGSGPRGRRFRRALVAGALAALACAAPAAAGELPPGSASYGLVAASPNGAPAAKRAEAYERLYAAGVRAIRVDIPWATVEGSGDGRGTFDFSGVDAEIELAASKGLKTIGLLVYGHPDYSRAGREVRRSPFSGGLPPFAVGNANYFPPDDPADFARYARAAAENYGDEVIAWEVWNEQNQGWRFWLPHEDPAAYADLLCAAAGELRAADPQTPVVFGGVFFPAVPPGLPGMSGPDFVRTAHAARPGLGGCYDAVAYHPYPYPFTAPELDVPVRRSVFAARDQMRAALEPSGNAGKPLWITEVGWPTNTRAYGVSRAKQAQYLARTFAASFAQGLPVVTWYAYGDESDPSGMNQEAAFGLVASNGTPKPALAALDTLTSVLEGSRFARDLSTELGLPRGGPEGADLAGGRGYALEYRSAGERIVALWYANESAGEAQGGGPQGGTVTPASVSVRLPVSAASVRVVDHLGPASTVAADGGAVELELGPGPVYVVEPLPAG